MNKKLKLAYSTCPNDTFIFHALAHGLSDNCGLSFEIALDDVETLNQKALEGYYDISKLSFAAIAHLQKSYALLQSGAALGRGCGPLVVTPETNNSNISSESKIAIPGKMTTASLLLELYLKKKTTNATAMTFDEIMPKVQNRMYDFGLIIHEGRFTYPEYGLKKIIDLGEWWESETSLPIPLGGIAVKRSIPIDIAKKVEKAISNSIQFAMKNREASKGYILKYAQEMEQEVIDKHVELYVNNYSVMLDSTGRDAVKTLFSYGESQHIINRSDLPLFATA
jgi:1,4-dihydroxy-6-naphthoate synthase